MFIKDPPTFRFSDNSEPGKEIVIEVGYNLISFWGKKMTRGEPLSYRFTRFTTRYSIITNWWRDNDNLFLQFHALCSGELRGTYEAKVVDMFFWEALVKNANGNNFLKDHFPELHKLVQNSST